MEWADDIRIETPEQIDVSLEVAGLGSRFEAQVIDWGIKILILLVPLVLALLGLGLLGGQLVDKSVQTYALALLGLLGFGFAFGYDVYFEVSWNGQTPGKWIAGIRVIREHGAPVDFRTACIRNFLAIADFLPICHLLGALLILLSARGQRLGDMAAGTIVIRERSLELPSEPAGEIESLASDEFSFTGDQLAACSPKDRHVLRSFFQRYEQMELRARQLLALRLAEEFAQRTSYQSNHAILDGPSAESFLATLYRDLEGRARLG